MVIWSWCGQASSYTQQQVLDWYLSLGPTKTIPRHVVYDDRHHRRNRRGERTCTFVTSRSGTTAWQTIRCSTTSPHRALYLCEHFGRQGRHHNCDYDSDSNAAVTGTGPSTGRPTTLGTGPQVHPHPGHSQPLNCNRRPMPPGGSGPASQDGNPMDLRLSQPTYPPPPRPSRRPRLSPATGSPTPSSFGDTRIH